MKKVLLGILIGLTYIIPGLCSASMAISLGVYEDMLELFSSFYKPKIIKKHFLFIIGIIIGVIIIGMIFMLLFDKFQWIFLSIFVGFILGKTRKKNNLRVSKRIKYPMFIFIIMVTIILNFIGNNRLISFGSEMNVLMGIILFFVSIISSLALILPGISGSMFLFVFGFYDLFLKSIKQIITQLFSSQTLQYENFVVLLVFGSGFIFGILTFSKIIDKLSKKYPNAFLLISSGFLYGSLIVLLINLATSVLFSYRFLISLFILGIGVFIARKTSLKE